MIGLSIIACLLANTGPVQCGEIKLGRYASFERCISAGHAWIVQHAGDPARYTPLCRDLTPSGRPV